MEEEKVYLTNKLQEFLMQVRKAPNSTGSNAYELMFDRNISTFLDLIKPNPLVTQKKIV